MLDVRAKRPVLHVSGKYPAAMGHIAAVVPLAMHPTIKTEVIVYDLRADPSPLLELDADAIRARMFTRTEDLPDGEERLPLKTIRTNRAPIVVPMNTLTDAAREEWRMDAEAEARHLTVLQQATGLEEKLAQVFGQRDFEPATDPDQDLYGGFLSDGDRRLCERVQRTAPEELAQLHPGFEAAKLHELLFRYRARNWPQTLSAAEKARWEEYRRERVNDPAQGISLADYRKKLSQLAIDTRLSEDQRALVDALIDWPAEIGL
jgi:exodeoxyribonuclease-1